MKLVSFSLSTQCSLPSTAKLASTHLDDIDFHKHKKKLPTSYSKHQAASLAFHWAPQKAAASQQATRQDDLSQQGAGGQLLPNWTKIRFQRTSKATNWPTFQHRCRSGLHGTQHQVLTQSRHQNSCRRAQKKLLRQCSPHQDGPEEQELPKHKNWTFEEKKLSLSHSCALLLPVIYFSPFVSPKTAILLLERLNIPVTDISDSEPIIYIIIIYRTTPSLSILSRQEYIAATWWESIFKIYLSEHFPTWTAESVFKRWGSCPCTGRNPPDSESWQSIINSTTPSLLETGG